MPCHVPKSQASALGLSSFVQTEDAKLPAETNSWLIIWLTLFALPFSF
jgi:hypothetical protein